MVKIHLVMVALLMLSIAISAQNDNCCFVDRQCTTNEEWVKGYYAFQNNQCAAPADSQPQPAASVVIDNCCFSGWQCDTDAEWTSGYFAFQHDHCFSQSHWEKQMSKREAAREAPASSDQNQQEAQSRRSSRNRQRESSNQETEWTETIYVAGFTSVEEYWRAVCNSYSYLRDLPECS